MLLLKETRHFSLSLVATLIFIGTTNADAFEINKSFYGTTEFAFGYNFQKVKSQDILNIEPDGNLNFHTLTLGGGFNVYYKLSHTI